MKEKIKQWLDLTIKTKQGQAKEIISLKNQIDKILKTLEDAKSNEQYAIEQNNKTKLSLSKKNKEFCELEIKSNEKISELEKEIKKLNKTNKKLEKELKK